MPGTGPFTVNAAADHDRRAALLPEQGLAGRRPEDGWTAAQTLWKALNSVAGKVEDPEALVQALRRVRYVGAMGPFHYDENLVLDASRSRRFGRPASSSTLEENR
jgi:hypothetical protein